jgi:anti-sigma28 factor (negative regulator of flagellin synthesis)
LKAVDGGKKMFKEKNPKTSYAEMASRVSEVSVNRKYFLDGLHMIAEGRKEKLAVLKKAITEGAYKVQAEDIADKLLKKFLFELALKPSYQESLTPAFL